jgi:uncharacterized protein (TIGR00369 family)
MVSSERIAELVAEVEDRIPFNRYLGLTDFRLEGGIAYLRLGMRDELVGNFDRGTLHGGVISSTFDVIGGVAALFGVAEQRLPDTDEATLAVFENLATIDLRVDYLRPGIGEWYEASAKVLRAGKRVVVTRMILESSEGVEVAVGTGTYIVG